MHTRLYYDMSNRYYRPWSAPYAPPNEDRPSQYQVVHPGWLSRYPILPPLGQPWITPPPIMTLLPFYYPMMSYPLQTYIPSFEPAYPLYSQCVSMETTAQQPLHITNQQLSSNHVRKVCEEACHNLLENTLHELVREVVCSCIDDIVTNYLSQANLLLDSELLRRESCYHGNNSGLKVGGVYNLRPLVAEKDLSRDEMVTANRVCESLMIDMMFEQLLQALLSTRERVVSSGDEPTNIILNELMFEELLKLSH